MMGKRQKSGIVYCSWPFWLSTQYCRVNACIYNQRCIVDW